MADIDHSEIEGDPRWAEARANSYLSGSVDATYGPMLESFRLFQDRFAGAALPEQDAREITAELNALNETLRRYQVPERQRADGRRPDLPGRGSPLLPPFVVEKWTEQTISGHVTFGRFHLGGNAAAHGGTLPLFFDDVLGRVANHGFSSRGRTAFLTVNFRKVTPLNVSLPFEASLDKVEGRKRWASGRLLDDSGALLCDANGLWIELLAGQQ